MLKKYAFKNYKAFSFGEIEIKPITIFLGANSSGKSSLIQLLLMMLQTFMIEPEDSTLRLNGKYVTLGEGENILYKKQINKKLTLSFTFKSLFLNSGIEQLTENFLRNINWAFRDFISYGKTILSDEKESLKELRRNEQLWSSFYNQFVEKELNTPLSRGGLIFIEELIERISVSYNIINEGHIKAKEDKSRSLKFFYYEVEDFNPLRFKEAFELIKVLSRINLETYDVSYDIKYDKRRNMFEIIKHSIIINGKTLLEFKKAISPASRPQLKSQILDNRILSKYSTKYNDMAKYSGFNVLKRGDINNPWKPIDNLGFGVLEVVHTLFESTYSDMSIVFQPEMINYVNPLRASPRRYYFINEANDSGLFNSIDGNNVTEILKRDEEIKANVNKWLKRFNLSVSVETLRDIIHKLKVHQNGLSLDIVDVGFGISQVLPVIIQGFLTAPNSLLLIEQPEIHLHPRMQAELADLFIDMARGDDRNIIIETHSEYLLQRLKRRISEGDRLFANEVAIYFVHTRKKSEAFTRIERLNVDAKGGFDFPEEFFSTFMEDTTEFIKNQVS